MAIDCLAGAFAGTVVVLKARTATRVEIASAMQLAETLVADTIRLLKDAPAPVLLRSIDLHFQSMRHVRILVEDAAGHPVDSQPGSPPDSLPQSTSSDRDAPDWFSPLIAPKTETKEFPILVKGERIGAVTLTSAPSDEIGEIWVYAKALLITAFCLNIAMVGALFLLFGRVLAPLIGLVAGLKDLERRNYTVRLPRALLPELATLTDHFNSTAEALLIASEANRQLNRKLVTAQDDERRRTALELHDEVGPCLFALDVNASSILAMSRTFADSDALRERAVDVMALVERVQGINRRVLDRLRPIAIGRIPLKDCIVNLLVEFESVETTPVIDHDLGNLSDSYGAVVDLTIYRCVQEGLFNAIRHARSTSIRLTVREGTEGIVLRIADNGIGMTSPRPGFGLSGMRERVEALCGAFTLTTSASGTRLDIFVPLDRFDPAPSTFEQSERRFA